MPPRALAPVLQYLRHVRGPDEEPSDQRLLDQFVCHRDDAAFAELIARHGPMVLGVCRRVLRHAHDAEDAFQATFVLLARKAPSLRRPELLGPWLHGVARRTSLKARAQALRRRSRERPVTDTPAPERPDAVDLADLRPVLDEAVGGLPELYRAPFVLCHLQGMTQAEAARRLGCPANTVATRLARARQRLRVRLASRGLAMSAGTLLLPTETPAASLVRMTLRAVTIPSTVPAPVASLAEGVSRVMLMEKLRTALFLAAAVGLTVVAAGTVVFRNVHAEEPRDAPAAVVTPPRAEPAVAVARTDNFHVEAPTAQVARLVLEAAERHRKAHALAWLGEELPPWKEPCKLRVKLGLNGAGGATSFNFDRGRVLSRDMSLEGSLERILASCLPHEVAHTVLADYFGKPVPRWADEGAAILSEDDDERERHGKLARQIVETPGRAIALRRLFAMSDYPRDVMALYAQGYAVAQFLVDKKDRKTFLKFVKQGLDEDWDRAAQAHYGYRTVEELEDDWLRAMLGKDRARNLPPTDRVRDEPKEKANGILRGSAPAPVAALARWVDGCVELRWPVEFYQPVERTVPRETAEGTTRVTTYERFSEEVKRRFTPGQLRAYDVSGKPVNARQLADRLAKETAVLLAADGNDVDPFHLQLIKEGTLILAPTTPPPAVGLTPPPAATATTPRGR